ncbi:MAG TPA: WYL domain-containing protein [Phycisphaerae bacterium]|nr:WYL domain-containing protein [Phycisphaerae bacterium]
MPQGEQIQRHWNLLRTLQTRGEGVPLAQLARDFGVSERTIQRDFETLQEQGFPIEYEEDAYGKRFWRMPHNFFKSGAMTLSLTEAVSLHLAERFFAPLAGTHFAEGLESALTKIRSLIPSKAMDYFSELNGRLYVRPFGSTDYSGQADAIRLLDEAIWKDRTVEVDYRSLWRGDSYSTLYDPYGLVLHLDDLFLVGRSHRAQAIRIFKVNRILAVRPTDKGFTRPADFNLENLFRSSFGIIRSGGESTEIVVRFTGMAAAVVEERIWHDSQKLQWRPTEAGLFDGECNDSDSLVATFQLSEVVEFKRWLKGFGDRAVVIKPEWLRNEIREELLSAAARYAE